MPAKKTLLSISIVATVVVLVTVMVMSKDDVTKIENKKEVKYVTTAVVQQGNWQPMHSVIGKIDSDSVNEMKSEVNAKVKAVLVSSGDFVIKGQLLIELDDESAQRDLQRLNAQLTDLNARIQIQKRQHKLDRQFLTYDLEQLEKSKDNYASEKKLLSKQLISNSRFEQVESELNQSTRSVLQRQLAIDNQNAQQQQLQASLTQLQINIDVQNEQIDAHKIIADFNGAIGNLTLKVNEKLSVGASMLTLFNDESRLFNVKVSSQLASQKSSELVISDQTYPILSVNPLLEAQQAGQLVVFDISGQDLSIGSYQYAYWVSPAIEDSFLIDPKALFEYERVYYLKEKEAKEATDTDIGTETETGTETGTQTDLESEKTKLEKSVENVFELVEAKVKLHGINIIDKKEYWIATSENLPDDVLLLTSQLRNLYSGIEVTNVLPKIEISKKEDDTKNKKIESEQDTDLTVGK
ncbi:MAG: biotin/lipoyl-binding protein [Saccharospirillaceae bacterium]|nr:biotin/lipoyl-binding protein [Pseudomonadales bacterium]NRB78079.1 biotin/lipoyl-binding protein [Saccharospirillaceae bacterium]